MSQNNSTVALLMVTYNRQDLLSQILNSIQSFKWDVTHFIIVDNASNDDTAAILEQYKNESDLSILTLDENIGHGAGLAIGLDFIKVQNPNLEYVIFLEDDSIPQAGYLEFLLGKIQKTDFSMVSSAGSLVSLGKRTKLQPSESEILEADFALFDGAIARFQDLLKVGFPVKDWFMMFDDFEYCHRIRKAGLKIGVVSNPFLEILHEGWAGGVSHSHLWRSYYQSRNFIHFVRLHFSTFALIDCLILQSKRLIGGLFSSNGIQNSKMRWMGIRAGLRGKTGRSLDLITLKEI
jgi:GT2 family glycosyltransferase